MTLALQSVASVRLAATLHARLLTAVVLLLTVGAAGTSPAETPECTHLRIETETLRQVIAAIDGYDVSSTTNQARFVADVLLALARRQPSETHTPILQIEPDRFFEAWLHATGLDADQAPVSMRMVLEFNQRFVIETSPPASFQTRSASLPEPRILSVHIRWPDEDGLPGHYRYRDTGSNPAVELMHERTITYQLLDFGNMIALENIRGISGKPISGGFGALFDLLGLAEIRATRFAVAKDQTQVNRTRSRKLFTFTTMATISADGEARSGIPDGRDDLAALGRRLDADFTVSVERPAPPPCRSARRPAHFPATEQMQVDMPD